MDYIVISDFTVFGKSKGAVLSESELLAAGTNIEALIEAGHIELSSKSAGKESTTEKVAK